MKSNSASGRIAIFEGSGIPFLIRDEPLPTLSPGEILVANEFVTLCRSDLNTFSGKRKEKCPSILGHEVVGRILRVAPPHPRQDLRGKRLEEGDRITWAIYASSPQDSLSQRGIPQKARDLFKYGHERIRPDSNFHGGLATHTVLRNHTPVIAIDPSVPLPVAALINCSVATLAGALRLAGDCEAQEVVVSGSGMLGLVACAMLEENGAKPILAVDPLADRREKALSFGADRALSPEKMKDYRKKARQVIELSGVASAMENSLDWLQIGGKAVWVGGTHPMDVLKVDGEAIIRNLLTIQGLHNYNEGDLRKAVTFIEAHHRKYPFKNLVSKTFSLLEVNEAFAFATEKNPYRVGIRLDN